MADNGTELAAIAEAAAVAEAVSNVSNDEVTLSNGVVLRVRSVPPLAFREAGTRVRRPEPPMVVNRETNREEPNTSDPDYISRLAQYEGEQMSAVANVMFLLGTSVVRVPEGISRPEDDDWIETLEAIGLPIENKANKKIRYLSWLRLYALETQADIETLAQAVARRSGTTETEVVRAADAFLSDETRRTDNGVSNQPADKLGY